MGSGRHQAWEDHLNWCQWPINHICILCVGEKKKEEGGPFYSCSFPTIQHSSESSSPLGVIFSSGMGGGVVRGWKACTVEKEVDGKVEKEEEGKRKGRR